MPLESESKPKIPQPEKKASEIKVPYKFSMRQIYHIRGRYGKYFWAVAGSGIFLMITVTPTLWARSYGDKRTAKALFDDPDLWKGVQREHLPKGVLKQLERLEQESNSSANTENR